MLATSKVAPVNSDSDDSISVLSKKKASTGVLSDLKNHGEKTPKNHDVQKHSVIFKKEVMPENKWRSHRYYNSFGIDLTSSLPITHWEGPLEIG